MIASSPVDDTLTCHREMTEQYHSILAYLTKASRHPPK